MPRRPNPARAGAQALLELLRHLHQQSERNFTAQSEVEGDCYADQPHTDPRDYIAFAKDIEASILANIVNAEAARREGYLRAMTDLFCIVGDGCGPDLDNWDPLAATEIAFAASRGAAEAVGRARHG